VLCAGGARESNCIDGIDNDADGAIDCEDADCAAHSTCAGLGEPEVCDDGFDNDLDGTFDCGDDDCLDDAFCVEFGNCSEEDVSDLEDVDYTALVFDCGLSCLGADSRACAGECTVSETGISRTCADCFGGMIACAQAACLAVCVAEVGGASCIECVTSGCGDDFFLCSGLELDF
jgi:hypothetical protein